MKQFEKQIDEMIKQIPRSYENERILYLLRETKKEILASSEKAFKRAKSKKQLEEQEILRKNNFNTFPNRVSNPNVLKGIDELIKKENETINKMGQEDKNDGGEYLNLNG